mmetsp:Transcript_54530/g.119299  ORF Transcript_54530/g.119299 Transcript_54530/m.119299 type:complete len:228 (+) Transcript_54530:22-705(+)
MCSQGGRRQWPRTRSDSQCLARFAPSRAASKGAMARAGGRPRQSCGAAAQAQGRSGPGLAHGLLHETLHGALRVHCLEVRVRLEQPRRSIAHIPVGGIRRLVPTSRGSVPVWAVVGATTTAPPAPYFACTAVPAFFLAKLRIEVVVLLLIILPIELVEDRVLKSVLFTLEPLRSICHRRQALPELQIVDVAVEVDFLGEAKQIIALLVLELVLLRLRHRPERLLGGF